MSRGILAAFLSELMTAADKAERRAQEDLRLSRLQWVNGRRVYVDGNAENGKTVPGKPRDGQTRTAPLDTTPEVRP